MIKDEVLKLALEAGGYLAELPNGDAWLFTEDEYLERFAALVASAEREACAKLCDAMAVHPEYVSEVTKLAALAIRARK